MAPVIRLAGPADAEQVQAIYAPACLTAVSFEAAPPSVEEMRRRILDTLPHWPWLVCDDAGTIQGYVYAGRHRERTAYRWSVDVSVYVRADIRRRGVGRALYTSLFQLLAVQGFVNAYAGIALPNPASVGLHEAVGFWPVGIYRQVGYKNGAWHDVGWWQRPLGPHEPEPGAPKDVPTAQAAPAWETALAAGLPLLRSG
jgi:phosphinothricin acetyltransferase